MKILWVVNVLFPSVANRLNVVAPVSGGWMFSLADGLKQKGVELAIATVVDNIQFQRIDLDGVRYYLIPKRSFRVSRNTKSKEWCQLLEDFRPDVIHIHGTEYAHGIEIMNAAPNAKFVVSVQGLVSIIHRYYLAGMSSWDILRNITMRDLIRRDTLWCARRKFICQSSNERRYLRAAQAVVGRTDWDRAHVKALAPDTSYRVCNESLREQFYTAERWSLSKCRQHSIFLSQGSYPLKGLHQVIKAIGLLLTEYPQITVEVAGHDILRGGDIMSRIKRTGYGKYIGRLIKKFGLDGRIIFLGPLCPQEMKAAYLRAHVFVCASSIENSPNSLGEAQILGVPCIASYCGGVPYMTTDGVGALLYRFDEYEMLAERLRMLFTSPRLADSLSQNGLIEAQERHERSKNVDDLEQIYISVANNDHSKAKDL